jgi:predicted MFS family arabinose efflux permease
MLLFLISLCGLASSVAYRSVDPLVTSLARDFSVPVATAALVSSAYALPFALSQPVLGPIGDVFGKGRLLAICLFVLTGTLIIGAFAPNFESMLSMRFIGGLAAGGTMPVAMALIGDTFPPEKRQVAMARFLAVTLIGQIFTSTLSGLLAVTVGWRGFFLLAACITFTAALGALWKLQEPQKVVSQAFGVGSAFRRYGAVFANPKSWLCFGTVFFEAIAIFGVTPYVSDILETNHLGGPREAGFVIAGIGVGGLICSLILGWLMRFFTRVGFMAAGGTIGAFALAATAWLPDWIALAGFFTLLGFGFVMLHNSVQTEVSSLAPAARASAFSMHAFSFFMGQALGPVIFGYGLQHLGLSPMLIANGVLLGAVGLGAAWLFSRHDSELN